jgi:hypothetical protein
MLESEQMFKGMSRLLCWCLARAKYSAQIHWLNRGSDAITRTSLRKSSESLTNATNPLQCSQGHLNIIGKRSV